MKTTVDKILPYVLTPLSWLYGMVMWVRNKLFDWGILSQMEYDVPVVGVGNLTVGGTGKTPHTEYILANLCGQYNVAVLSRGYKRKTKGFIAANSKSTPETIGDEPWQIYNKFGRRIKVAVCENRRMGITELLNLYPDLDLIVLDDSFQHRWVKPKVNILLMEYSRPVYKDHLLPLGRLRESSHEINRADKVIVTKCPESLNPIDYRIVTKDLDLMKFQKIYFSRYVYDELRPVFPDDARFSANLNTLTQKDSVYLLTGIAHPRYFVLHFKDYPFRKRVEHFSDHHNFSRKDIAKIEQRFRDMKGERKLIITTEKDAVRLVHNPYFPPELKPFVFFQPIRVEMVAGPHGHDNDLILDLKQELRLAVADESQTSSVIGTQDIIGTMPDSHSHPTASPHDYADNSVGIVGGGSSEYSPGIYGGEHDYIRSAEESPSHRESEPDSYVSEPDEDEVDIS
ncbi:MAG: tetraacyldisaccharide 4'-kinase [Muribaculaceae bacterium]|nr:tetraacyldisaccharide 4'-kinase [Muribaculaceae bacterium]